MHTTQNPTRSDLDAAVAEALAGIDSYEALAAAYRDGLLPGNGVLALCRGRRIFGVHGVASAMGRANDRGARLGRKVAAHVATAYRYTDADLDARIAAGEEAGPGRYREAVLLRTLRTVEARRAVVAAAGRFTNATPDAGRWSDAIGSCLSDGAAIDASVA